MAEQLAELNKGVDELTVETPSGVVKDSITTSYSVKKYGNVVTVCTQFTPTVLNTFQNVLEGLPIPAEGVIYQVGTVNNSGTVNINAWISINASGILRSFVSSGDLYPTNCTITYICQ